MRKIDVSSIKYERIASLEIEEPKRMVEIPDVVYEKRLKVLRKKMKQEGLAALIIYGDREHYSNFRYIAGYEPRFEEGIMVIHSTGTNYVLLGNECLGMHKESKIAVKPILCQILSLPNQTMAAFSSMENIYSQAGIREEMNVGVVGWKLFTGEIQDKYRYQFDIPEYLVSSLKNVVGKNGCVKNVTGMFIDLESGFRAINDVHSIALFEFGAATASQRLKNLVNNIAVGKTERELAAYLNPEGLVLSCHSIVASGANRFRGLISPTDKEVHLGDAFASCMGMEGGLSSRNGYIAFTEDDLTSGTGEYIEKVAKPYFTALAAWYEKLSIGITGGEIFKTVNSIMPQSEFGWILNPGHLIGTEEWLSSPVYENSEVEFKSGMLVQMDIIPDVEGYSSPGAEDGVCIADEKLREQIKKEYPEVWDRMQKRREYMINELGIKLHEEILPLSNLAGEYRPLLLNKELGFMVKTGKL